MSEYDKPKTKSYRIFRVFNYPVYLIVRAFSWLICLLPFSAIHSTGKWIGNSIYDLMGSRRKIILENLDIAFGGSLSAAEKEKIARESYQSAALSMIELFTVPKTLKEAQTGFSFLNADILEREFQKGKGVILVISHLGSWEYLSFLPFLKKQVWSVVVKEIRNPYLNQAINRFRKMMTVKPISKDHSAAKEIFRALKQNQGVAILMDQWAGPEGIWKKFFGRETSTTDIPARLALKQGCPLVPAYCIRKGPGLYEIVFTPPIDAESGNTETITEKINEGLAEQIKKYPGQWLWMHRRWKPKPASLRG